MKVLSKLLLTLVLSSANIVMATDPAVGDTVHSESERTLSGRLSPVRDKGDATGPAESEKPCGATAGASSTAAGGEVGIPAARGFTITEITSWYVYYKDSAGNTISIPLDDDSTGRVDGINVKLATYTDKDGNPTTLAALELKRKELLAKRAEAEKAQHEEERRRLCAEAKAIEDYLSEVAIIGDRKTTWKGSNTEYFIQGAIEAKEKIEVLAAARAKMEADAAAKAEGAA
jgi:hypothetical protein